MRLGPGVRISFAPAKSQVRTRLQLRFAAAALNAANLTIVMLETPTAIANAEEIAAVPGVDVLLIGTNDLCAEMGIHGDFGNERVADAYQTMIAAARKHGKFPGMAGIYNETIMPRYIEMGARFILSGQDAAFMAGGGGGGHRALR